MATPSRKLIVETLPTWKEYILYFVARCLGLKGVPIGLIYYENEQTINDIVKNNEEDAMNRVRTDKLTEMESGE